MEANCTAEHAGTIAADGHYQEWFDDLIHGTLGRLTIDHTYNCEDDYTEDLNAALRKQGAEQYRRLEGDFLLYAPEAQQCEVNVNDAKIIALQDLFGVSTQSAAMHAGLKTYEAIKLIWLV